MGSTWTYNRGFQEATGKFYVFVVWDDICTSPKPSTGFVPTTTGRWDCTTREPFNGLLEYSTQLAMKARKWLDNKIF